MFGLDIIETFGLYIDELDRYGAKGAIAWLYRFRDKDGSQANLGRMQHI